MIVRDLDGLKAANSFRENPGVWSSARYLLRGDGLGFTVTETRVSADQTQLMEYKNHVEANLVIDGHGELTDLVSGDVHQLGPGSMYALDGHERHQLKSVTAMRIVCVFTPALVGTETHDAHGSYPSAED